MKQKSEKTKDDGMQPKYTPVINTPLTWGYNNRTQAIANAQKAAAKREGMKLVRRDAKTWVYA